MSADPAANVGKGAPKIEPPHPSKPIMRRPGADLEEKHEPRGTSSAKPQTREKRSEASEIALDQCRDREADVQRWK